MITQDSYNNASLAFVGDAVYSLFVREALAQEANDSSKVLHSRAVTEVRALAQARAYSALQSFLKDGEMTIMRRGRNSHCGSPSNGASRVDYQKSTGVECLFGWLWLTGQDKRARELFSIIRQSLD